MKRRDFLTTAALVSGSLYMSACGSNNSDAQEQTQQKPEGALTLYYEYKIAGPEIPLPADGTTSGVSVSVENHVTIHADDTDAVNTKAAALLTVAQDTYQPSNLQGNGLSGTLSDSNYKKAVTTEILQNAYTFGDTRDYLFHGVWESVADHENSHIDPRFMQAAGPVGAYVIAGPVEPFYQTIILHNKA